MHEELRRSNSIGDLQGIRYFANIVLKDECIKQSSAQQLCSFANDMRLNFSAAVHFFNYLGYVDIHEDIIMPTELGRYLLQLQENEFDNHLSHTCLKKIIEQNIFNLDAIHFDVFTESFYVLRHAFPFSAAVFRNVLIQLNALSESGGSVLAISPALVSLFKSEKQEWKTKLTLEKLKLQLEQQAEQGALAEAYVFNFEKARLSSSGLATKIQIISDIDVTAGYDIVSFENITSVQYDRFIEVKSYCGKPHFYWSKNEISTAELYGERYYLYLVDAEAINHSGYLPTIIKNPAKTVLETGNWLIQANSYLVLPINDED